MLFAPLDTWSPGPLRPVLAPRTPGTVSLLLLEPWAPRTNSYSPGLFFEGLLSIRQDLPMTMPPAVVGIILTHLIPNPKMLSLFVLQCCPKLGCIEAGLASYAPSWLGAAAAPVRPRSSFASPGWTPPSWTPGPPVLILSPWTPGPCRHLKHQKLGQRNLKMLRAFLEQPLLKLHSLLRVSIILSTV